MNRLNSGSGPKLKRRPTSEEEALGGGSSKVVQKLGFVSRVEFSGGFHLDDDPVLHKEIGTEFSDKLLSEPHLNGNLGFNSDSGLLEDELEGFRVDRLEKTLPQLIVDLEEDASRLFGQITVKQTIRFRCHSFSDSLNPNPRLSAFIRGR